MGSWGVDSMVSNRVLVESMVSTKFLEVVSCIGIAIAVPGEYRRR